MGDRPTLHLRSAAWANAHRAEVPLQLSIQRSPNGARGELGAGFVHVLRPTADEWELGRRLVKARSAGDPMDPHALAAYRDSMIERWMRAYYRGQLAPGVLAYVGHAAEGGPVPDGAVLTCSCSAAHAAAGECHRAWAAPLLARSWIVYLDGTLFTRESHP